MVADVFKQAELIAMSKQSASDTCIYTIVHTDKLHSVYRQGSSGKFTEKKRWSTAKTLLIQAQRHGKKLLVFFAPAEATDKLIYYAKLESIDIDTNGTTYKLSELTPYDEPKTSLNVVSTGKPLHVDFIRPYAICKTPEKLL